MKAVKFWGKAILTRVILFGLFYLWQEGGIENAGNLVIFYAWVMVLLGFVGLLATDEQRVEVLNREPAGYAIFSRLTSAVFVGLLVWYGFLVTASAYVLVWAMSIALNRAAKKKARDSDEYLSSLG